MNLFSNLNAWAILTAVIISNVLGFLWYSPVLFGKAWLEALGHQAEESKNSAPFGPIVAMVTSLISTTVLSILILHLSITGVPALDGLITGFLAGAGLVAPVLATAFAFEGKKPVLFLIDIGYYLVALSMAGLILGLWQ